MVCEVWRVARSTVYAMQARGVGFEEPKKRGPKTEITDEALVVEIREVLRESDFLGEGHRKVRARLRSKGIRVGKNRVLRLMRENGLLAPVLRGHPRGDQSHSGRITTDAPNELWGTDATRFYTKADGWCWLFVALDHCVSDVVGWHVAKRGDRWAALEPVRQGVRAHMVGYAPKIALGLGLRHDWGPQYTAHQFEGELQWLGDPVERGLCGRAGVQRCRGALHPHAQGGVSVPPRLSRALSKPETRSASSSIATTTGGSSSAMDIGPRSRSARSSLGRRHD